MKYSKDQTRSSHIEKAAPPEFVVIPLVQHIGTPAKALVAPGEQVNLGQLIGATDAFVTANIHSSVSGVVEEIIKIKNPQGSLVEAIKIKNDFQETLDPHIAPKKKLELLTAEEIREIVREAGLVGLGGAGFPTHVKLTPPEGKKIDTVILNGAECEPYLTADHRLLLEKPAQVLYGLQAIVKAVGAERAVIAIEDNKLDAVEVLKKAGAGAFGQIKIIKNRYPAGAERVLVKKILNRQVPNKGIPLDVGVLVTNVGTANQLAQTLYTGIPLVDRVVTVSGAFSNPGNYLVKIGTLLKDLVKLPAESELSESFRLILGGPMMGFTVDNLEQPVVKGSSGILLLKSKNLVESNCIRCGRCIESCPLGLYPYQDQGLDECMECGCCAYECPANIFLVQKARLIKQKLKEKVK